MRYFFMQSFAVSIAVSFIFVNFMENLVVKILN
jgi:hypothetical protein